MVEPKSRKWRVKLSPVRVERKGLGWGLKCFLLSSPACGLYLKFQREKYVLMLTVPRAGQLR